MPASGNNKNTSVINMQLSKSCQLNNFVNYVNRNKKISKTSISNYTYMQEEIYYT